MRFIIGLLILFFLSLAYGSGETRFKSGLISEGALSVGTSSAADAKSLLDVSSTTKGVLFPRMTTTQRDAITSPTTGLIIFNTTTNRLNSYSGSGWIAAEDSLGFTAENSANKSTDGTMADNSTTKYPTQSAVVTYVAANGGAPSTNYAVAIFRDGDGYGSTNTKIPKFATATLETNTSGLLTITNSATTGLSITANRACWISIFWYWGDNTTDNIGFTLNSSALTTDISSITSADRIAYIYTGVSSGGVGSYGASLSIGYPMQPGDVIRPHTNGQTFTDSTSNMLITAREI